MITIISKDVDDVQDKIINPNVIKKLENFNEDYIKFNMGIEDENI